MHAVKEDLIIIDCSSMVKYRIIILEFFSGGKKSWKAQHSHNCKQPDDTTQGVKYFPVRTSARNPGADKDSALLCPIASFMQSSMPDHYMLISFKSDDTDYIESSSCCRLELEWERGRVFDSDVASVFQRVVADSKILRITHVSNKEERRQRPTGLTSSNCFLMCMGTPYL